MASRDGYVCESELVWKGEQMTGRYRGAPLRMSDPRLFLWLSVGAVVLNLSYLMCYQLKKTNPITATTTTKSSLHCNFPKKDIYMLKGILF